MRKLFFIATMVTIFCTISYAQDYDGPKIESYTFEPMTIDITNSSQTITVTAHVTDASGVDSAPIVYVELPGKSSATQQTGWFTRTSGDAKDGIYTATITIPKGKEGGEWEVFSNSFYDIYRNSSVWPVYPTSEKKTLTVINTAPIDTDGPVVESFIFEPMTIDITNSSQTITVTAHVTDASGVDSAPIVYVELPGKSSATQQTGWFTRTSGDAKDGIYTATITIPQGKEGGEWRISSNSFRDVNGNTTASTLYPTSEKKTLTVINTADIDTDGPKIESYTFEPTTIDITNSSQTITVTAHVTDASGVDSAPIVYVELPGKSSATQQTGWFTRTSGDAKDGIYTATITIPKGKEGGEWEVFSNSFYDIYRNSSVWPVYPTSEKKKLTVINNTTGIIQTYEQKNSSSDIKKVLEGNNIYIIKGNKKFLLDGRKKE